MLNKQVQVHYTTETLQAQTKQGKTKYWQKQIFETDGEIFTKSIYWQTNSVVQESEPKKIERKNVGKSNETTELEQAFLEVESEFKRQLDKGYSMALSGERSLQTRILPMLAQDYLKHQSKLPDQIIVESKQDGVRCLTNGVEFWTRKGKPYINEVAQSFKFSFEPANANLIFDGELILPAPYSFQHTVSAVKKYSELTDKLEYWVYDLIDLDNLSLPTVARKEMLVALISKIPNLKIKVLPYTLCKKQDVEHYHKLHTNAGFEGSMIRDPNSAYEINHRSYGLLKLKDFETDEFEIVDVIDGKAKETGLAIFVCQTTSKEQFNCRPEGDVSSRAEIFLNKESYIGKLLTVRFQGLTKDRQVPRFPVGVVVRDYE